MSDLEAASDNQLWRRRVVTIFRGARVRWSQERTLASSRSGFGQTRSHAAEVVVADCAGQGVDNGRVPPARDLDDEALGLAAVELGRALHRRGQIQPPARGRDGVRVVDPGLDSDDVTHAGVVLLWAS